MATKMKVSNNFPKFSLMILGVIMTITCYCQNFQVSLVAPGQIQFKYGCITSQQTYDIEYMAYRLSGLSYNKLYNLEVHNSTIFDNTGFEPCRYLLNRMGHTGNGIPSNLQLIQSYCTSGVIIVISI